MEISMNDIILNIKDAPCYSELAEIIRKELNNGNRIIEFNKAFSPLDETYYILLFRDLPEENYPYIKKIRKKDGAEYKSLTLADNKGCTEIRFGY